MSVAAAAQDGGWTGGLTTVSGLLGTLVGRPPVLAVVLDLPTAAARFLRTSERDGEGRRGRGDAHGAAEAAVVAATVDKSGPGPTQPDDIERAIRSTRAATGALPASGLLGRVALWVDDKPDNNRYEREALAASASASSSALVGRGPEPARHPDVRRRDLRLSRPEGRRRGWTCSRRSEGGQRDPLRRLRRAASASASPTRMPRRLRLHRRPEHAPPARRRGIGRPDRTDHRQECGVDRVVGRGHGPPSTEAAHDQAGVAARTRPPDHHRPASCAGGRHRRWPGRRRHARRPRTARGHLPRRCSTSPATTSTSPRSTARTTPPTARTRATPRTTASRRSASAAQCRLDLRGAVRGGLP